jgi:hypothetical protein
MRINLQDGITGPDKLQNNRHTTGVDCPGIKIRENAVVGEEPSPRSNAVLDYLKNGYKGWKKKHQYGRRWAAEGYFSSVKRIFGETVRASSISGMISETKRLFILYNMLIGV